VEAIVYKSTGSWYAVKANDGNRYNCRIKGIFKIDDISSTNPLAVGDKVAIEIENTAESSAVITEIFARKNYIARVSPHNKRQRHIVASNLDQAVLFAALREPKTSPGFIDRYLVSCEAFHVPPVIVFNKTDIYKKKEWEQLSVLENIYSSIGYSVLSVSLKNEEGLERLSAVLYNKISLLSGQSGTGKSTFINKLFLNEKLRTQEVSSWSGKGMHTTTFAEMFDLPDSGSIIDTPGIREFGLTDITQQELSHYFPEMRALLHDCKFNNCLHVNEPGCAVKQAVEAGKLFPERYISYRNILDTIEEDSY
jgi:ribosome biogenesis GTPase